MEVISQPQKREYRGSNDERMLRLQALLTRLWERMGDRYGALWTSPERMGEVWDKETQPWFVDLYDLSEEEFATALRLDLERACEFPPNAALFRKMAISERPSREPAHRKFESGKRLEHDGDNSKGLAAIEAAREMLRTGKLPPGHEQHVEEILGRLAKGFRGVGV